MPPLPRIHTEVLAELAEELRYAPREALLRDIERAEALAAEVDPATQYPADWVIFRVTSYRPDLKEAPLVPGAQILGDLSALVERLCHAARVVETDMHGPSEGADELAARWNVSRKTLDRWRRQGLIARRVHDDGGSARLRITERASEAFTRRNPDLVARAAGFSRIDPALEARMVRRARRYHDLLGCSMNQAAERLAARFARSREAVRQLLLRHDAAARSRGEAAIFDAPGALPDRTQRAIERAWRRGIEPGEMVRRYRRTRGGIHRVVNGQRLRRLKALDLGRIAQHALAMSGSDVEELLAAAPVVRPERARVPHELSELLSLMRERIVPVGVEERARARAEQALRARAARTIAAITPGFPEAQPLDRAETDLRWAAGLRAALARTQLRLMLETLESSLGLDLSHMRGPEARALIERALGALRTGLDSYDPWKSGRLAAPVGFAVAKVRPPAGGEDACRRRAQVRLLPGTPAPDWTLLVSPWSGALRPDRRFELVLGEIPPELGGVLAERFGLGPARPRTLEEIARERGLTIMQAGRLERRAVRAALERARASAHTIPG